MPDIRFICISDMHLGAGSSVLTAAPTDDALVQLVKGLKELVSKNEGAEKPVLILNGDILELALATTNVAAMHFRRFMELLLPAGEPPFVSRIVLIPGNHDHHIWQGAREKTYCELLERSAQDGRIPRVPHVTPLFASKTMRAALLDAAAASVAAVTSVPVEVVYPNFGLTSADGQRCVVFHHGHFLEPIYSLMSRLQGAIFPGRPVPTTMAELEADNGAWIDFFWSSLGGSGDVGPDVELVYDKLQDPKEARKLAVNLSNALIRRGDSAGWMENLKSFLVNQALEPLLTEAMRLSRNQTGQVLSMEEVQGLTRFLGGPLRNQLLSELGGELPASLSFIFGHTHRPFAQELPLGGYSAPIRVYNTGGWVVDSPRAEPQRGGAVVLLDEQLDAALVRMYSESGSPEGSAVRLERIHSKDSRPNPFEERISTLLEQSAERWRAFSRAVRQAVVDRQHLIGDHIKKAA